MSTTVMHKVQIIPLRRIDRHDLHDQDHSSSGSSASPPEKAPLTKQKGLKKVRTGCVTCKIRRVKCDETKPACNRCTSTGRNCDGYNILPRKKRSRTITSAPTDSTAPELEHLETIERCLSVVKVSQIERSALEFFQMRTAPALSSYFDNEFWNTLVLKISQAEPAIQHALIAVASLHRQREDGGDGMSISRLTVASNQSFNAEKRLDWMQARPSGENDPFALLHYNQAISHLSTRLSAGDSTSIEITLLACILFVCIEFLRGDAQPAIQHYKGGMKIAFDALAKSGHSQSTAERIRNDILPFFHRLELLSMLFGTDGSWDYPVDLMKVLPSAFSTMKDARDSLVHLMNLSLRFIRSTNQRRYTHDIVPEDVTQQFSLSQGLQAWQEKLDLLITTKQMTSRDLEATKILRIHQVVARVWLSCATEEHETSIDTHIPDFDTAIQLAESLNAASNTSTTSTFLFDMEIVSPLYFIAIKCRHPLLRRRAIAILHRMTRREGLWDSNMAAAVAERIVEIEEAKLLMIDETTLPDEVSRVHDSHIDQTASLDPSEHGVTFHMRDQGDWVIWRETIVIPEVERVSRRGRAASKGESVDNDREEMNIFMNGISLEG